MKGVNAVRREIEPTFQHASEEEYAAFLRACGYSRSNRESQLRYRARFVQAYPNLREWFHAPLAQRVDRLPGEEPGRFRGSDYRPSYCARPYLVYLGLHGYAQFDWEWLLAVPYLHLHPLLFPADAQITIPQLIHEAVALGYEQGGAERAVHWAITRLLMRAGHGYIEGITDTLLQEAIEASYQFKEQADVALYHGSQELHEGAVRKRYTTRLLLLHVVLYHRGQLQTVPRRVQPRRPPPASLKPRMEAVVTRYLAVRRLTARPRSVASIEQALRRFICWVARSHPQIETWASLTREQVLEFAEALNTLVGPRTGKVLSIFTKRGILSCLSIFFQDVAQWEWDEVPLRPLLGIGDLPKRPQLVPRYIPDDELDRLMTAIRTLECPYQRAALLIARWSGARRGEIRCLPFDCLDRYPDGTPRLHIPVGKTYSERLVPVTEEAAHAIRRLQSDRKGERGFTDFESGKETRYLFVRRGQLLSTSYLFDRSLHLACTQAGS